jgi:hypothetical protein
MSANRMVRIPAITPQELEICLKERKPIPTRWSESLYLEWFSANGRVLIEGAGFTCDSRHLDRRHPPGPGVWTFLMLVEVVSGP